MSGGRGPDLGELAHALLSAHKAPQAAAPTVEELLRSVLESPARYGLVCVAA